MKKFLVNIFATTGISLLLLSIVALSFHAKCVYVQTFFQVFAANAVTHFGLFIIRKLELRHAFIETFLDVALISLILLISGKIFNWFVSTPGWILVIMGFVIYAISFVLKLFHMRQEAQEINALIKKRNSRKKDYAKI